MSRSKRTEVLAAAERLFYTRGVASTGVDLVAREAGVSKATLYHHFPSKDALLTAYVDHIEARWRERLTDRLAALNDPWDRLAAYTTAYIDGGPSVRGLGQRGCGQQNLASELPDDHPALAVIVAAKRRTEEDVAGLLRELGNPHPEALAEAIVTLLEGGCIRSGMQRTTIDLAPVLAAVRVLALGSGPPGATH
ncbi:TetR/AcrR family transcriptional regulator [Phycicoccus sp. CSK15P-2]|uniref:TetR/AcrR family transcriptional regulator n=1 Tax=Phycicoccus sp. CSK15P-2 TaxID=2807627 RepID=UPI00194FE7BA|nr:TetR/AcrR family transcriptional regulator [Phycicoccus sp. CSK15P-2]MBM6405445.1 TetR/AcrR family transcriptional regulator [Phycicoccus sp. CSK15P-2]